MSIKYFFDTFYFKLLLVCNFLTFKVNFLCLKVSESFYFRSTFFIIDIFLKLQFLKHFIF